MNDDEITPTAPVVAPIGAGDETKPIAGVRKVEPGCEPMGTGIPAEVGTPTEAPLESRLQAESAIGAGDERKPSPTDPPSATASDDKDQGDEVPGDPESPIPAEGGPRPTGGAGRSGPDPSPPLPPIIIEALKSLARRQAASGISTPRLDDLIRRAEERVPAIERAPVPVRSERGASAPWLLGS